MPGIEDWINNPLEVVRNVYDRRNAASGDWKKSAMEYFKNKVEKEDGMRNIPLLNSSPFQLDRFAGSSLVRFRCMVQDMFDPEFYLSEFEVLNNKEMSRSMHCGAFVDEISCSKQEEVLIESLRNVTSDRMTYYCITIPGETAWVQAADVSVQPENGQEGFASTSSSSAGCTSKRPFEEEEGEVAMETDDSNTQQELNSKRVRGSAGSSSGQTQGNVVPPLDLNLPIPGSKGMACIVKVYETDDTICINDTFEFVGILSVSPLLAHSPNESGDSTGNDVMEEEERSRNPPASFVPRIHVVYSRKLRHINPLVTGLQRETYPAAELAPYLESVSTVREQLLSLLSKLLLNDQIAAEVLLCHLISSVYQRSDGMALGKFSLNLYQVPLNCNFSAHVLDLLSQLVTKICSLPFSIENLNSLTLLPKKNYTTNRLQSGLLQLSSDTHLVIDETTLSNGELNDTGVRNVAALSSLINWQKLQYDFSYHHIEFTTNLPVLVLSEGKTLLPSDFQILIQGSVNPGCDLNQYLRTLCSGLDEGFLTRVRTYLTLAMRMEYVVQEDVQKMIMDEFVENRQQPSSNNSDKMMPDDLHQLLVISRLLTVSHCESILTANRWEQARKLWSEARGRSSKRSAS